MKQNNVLVTGATGFVGSHLLQLLVNKGYKVRATKRSNSNMRWVKDIPNVEWVEADVMDIPSLEIAMTNIEWVFHTAAIVSFWRKERDAMLKVNIEGTANVVNTALAKGVERMVHFSSVAALGRSKPHETLTEKATWQQSRFNTWYAKSKWGAEQEVWRGMAEGLPAVIVNPGFIIGPGDWNDSSLVLFKKVYQGLKIYPENAGGFVDVRDVAAIALLLMEREISQERFIAVAENNSYRHIINLIAEKFGKRPPAIRAKSWMTSIAWRLEALKYALTGIRPVVTREVARLSHTSYIYDNSKIREALGYSFRDLDTSVEESCKWMREHLVH